MRKENYGQVIPRILSCPNTVLRDNISKKKANILIIFNVIRHLNMANPLTVNAFITVRRFLNSKSWKRTQLRRKTRRDLASMCGSETWLLRQKEYCPE